MRSVTYALLSPTENRTVLVTSPVPPEERAAVAAALMATEPSAEQLGFLSAEDSPCLTMAGGEFCGNATMAAAALLCQDRQLPVGECARVRLTVSGAPAPVETEITVLEDGGYRGRVSMPLPLRVERRRLSCFSDPVTVVTFPGITHIILETAPERPAAEDIVRSLCRKLHSDALGLMLFDRQAGRLTPLVYVETAGTLFWENSCASGTAAVGAFLHGESGLSVRRTLAQPGGALTVEADGGKIWISGTVYLLRQTVFTAGERP